MTQERRAYPREIVVDRNASQTESAIKIMTTGAKQYAYWSNNDAGIYLVDALHNQWVCVGTPEQIIQLIATKGKPHG